MRAPAVHYNEDCPENCIRKMKCKRIRDSKQLVLDLMNKVAESFPVFLDPAVNVVGSMKEKTKAVSRLK